MNRTIVNQIIPNEIFLIILDSLFPLERIKIIRISKTIRNFVLTKFYLPSRFIFYLIEQNFKETFKLILSNPFFDCDKPIDIGHCERVFSFSSFCVEIERFDFLMLMRKSKKNEEFKFQKCPEYSLSCCLNLDLNIFRFLISLKDKEEDKKLLLCETNNFFDHLLKNSKHLSDDEIRKITVHLYSKSSFEDRLFYSNLKKKEKKRIATLLDIGSNRNFSNGNRTYFDVPFSRVNKAYLLNMIKYNSVHDFDKIISQCCVFRKGTSSEEDFDYRKILIKILKYKRLNFLKIFLDKLDIKIIERICIKRTDGKNYPLMLIKFYSHPKVKQVLRNFEIYFDFQYPFEQRFLNIEGIDVCVLKKIVNSDSFTCCSIKRILRENRDIKFKFNKNCYFCEDDIYPSIALNS